ncbi:MAG: UDP-2,4-diacetamido-2,4,6-trideoxy-beta-L-altropyranose hydrolase [Magnetococcus sp. MYC-9]
MTVVFRVDASLQIGSGHVMRCMTLAGRLRAEGVAVHFICRAHPGHLMALIAAQDYPVHSLPVPDVPVAPDSGEPLAHGHWLGVSQAVDAREVIAVLRPLGEVAWLVVDHYGLDRRWETELATHVGRILVVDDLADRAHACDLLLDQNLHDGMQQRYRPWVSPRCTLLLGPHYALLRPQFAAARQRMRPRDGHVRRLLLFLGGADPGNVTTKALQALAPLDREVDVVLGGSNPHRAQIQALCAQNARFHCHVQVESMAELMLQADLALGAAGTTSWERCCLELPCLLLILADNQRSIARLLAERGVARLLGEAAEVSAAQITQAVRALMQEPSVCRQMQSRAASLCDGLGVHRVAMTLLPRLAKDGKPLGLRPVTLADARQIWEWQRHPDTRRWARNPAVPEYEAHCQWLVERLQDGHDLLHMITHDQQPAGVLRLCRLPEEVGQRHEISIYLAPDRYRLGIASGALQLGRMLLPDAELLAEVLEGNTASRALFESLGYVQQQPGIFIQFPSNSC